MAKKRKPIYFKVPAIGNEHYVYVCVDTKKRGLKRVRNYFKGIDDSTTAEDFDCRGKSFLNPKLFPIMWIDIEREDLIGTVAHEAFHCVLDIFEYNDIKVCKETEEVFAIILGAIVRAVEEEL